MKSAALIGLVSFAFVPRAGHAEPAPASFACVLQADALAKTKQAAVQRLAECGRDWIVLDTTFDGETPWERDDLDAVRRGLEGRKVLAYVSIGEAEEYRPYWRKAWGGHGRLSSAAPAWLGGENPKWKGNYRVKYWHAEWQQLVLNVIDDAMTRGFDGVYLDIVDAFETFEQEGAKNIDDRVNPDTKQSYRRDMVEWIKMIAARARTKNPAALVIPQNGSQLLAHADYLAVISAISIEDLFTNGNKLQPKAHTREVLGQLQAMTAARKPVLLIEYPTSMNLQPLTKKLATEHGMIWLITDRQLTTLGESGNPGLPVLANGRSRVENVGRKCLSPQQLRNTLK